MQYYDIFRVNVAVVVDRYKRMQNEFFTLVMQSNYKTNFRFLFAFSKANFEEPSLMPCPDQQKMQKHFLYTPKAFQKICLKMKNWSVMFLP